MENNPVMNQMSICHFIHIVLLTACLNAHAGNWPMFRGNEKRTGYYTDIVGYPKEGALWVRSFNSPIISSPAVVDNVICFGTGDSSVYSLGASNGAVIWKTKTRGLIYSSPLIHQNAVIIGSGDSKIYILNRNNGSIQSRLSAGQQFSSPAILPDNCIISGMGAPFKSFAAFESLKPKWDTTRAAWSIDFLQLSNSSPATNGTVVTIGAGDGKLYCIDPAIRDTLWSFQTRGGVNLSTPAIDDTLVYFAPGNYDKNIYAVGLYSGSPVWKNLKKRAGNIRVNTIHPLQFMQLLRLSPKDRLLACNRLRDKGIYIPDILETGEKRLNSAQAQEFFPYGGMKTSSVAVDNKNVYVVQKELGYPKPRFTLLAMDKLTGMERWQYSELRACVKMNFCSSPIVTKNHVFCGWGEGKIYGFSVEDGKKIWEDSLSGDILSSPAISDARLYVSTTEGHLYSFALNETAPGETFIKSTYCYPNPARKGVSHIQIYVPQKANMVMVIYNMAEKPVFRLKRTLAKDEKYVHTWNVTDVANGVYFALIRVKYTNGTEEKKVLKIAVLN